MYIEGAIPDLLQTLVAASHQGTDIFVAHGRNKQAEATFMQHCTSRFSVAHVPSSQLDEVYQTIDVDVLQLHKV